MSGGFIGREDEMRRLEEIYDRPGMQTCAVYGRRSVGKTRLLREFTRDKKTIFVQFVQRSYLENLDRLRNAISAASGEDAPQDDMLSALMRYLAGLCREERTVIVFDEFPYLTGDSPHVASTIQAFIDADARDSNCMFIICGSSVAMMRDAIEKVSSPLYGRFMERLEVRPLSYRKCMEFHGNMSDLDAIKVYLIAGGIPRYHAALNGDTFEESIAKCFFGSDPPLGNEASALISEERNPSAYSDILRCISDGYVEQRMVCERIGMDKGTCSKRFKEMEMLGYIQRRHPMAGSPRRPSFYIEDNILAFWYEVLRRSESILDSLQMPDEVKLRILENDINTFLGKRFELLCRDYIRENYPAGDIGKWWGRVDGADTDIDIVANVYDRKGAVSQIMAECKFSRRPVGFTELNTLIERTERSASLPNIHYMLFSRSGFTPELEEYAEDAGIALVDLDKLLGRTEPDDLESLPFSGFMRMG